MESLELLKWIEKNRDSWRHICNPDWVEMEEYKSTIEELIEKKLYTAVIVLLSVGYDKCDIWREMDRITDRLTEQFYMMYPIEKIMEIISEEIEKDDSA